jgi:hypothetical protein
MACTLQKAQKTASGNETGELVIQNALKGKISNISPTKYQ